MQKSRQKMPAIAVNRGAVAVKPQTPEFNQPGRPQDSFGYYLRRVPFGQKNNK